MNAVIVGLTIQHLPHFEFRKIAVCVRANDYIQLREITGDGIDLVGMIISTFTVALMTNNHQHLGARRADFGRTLCNVSTESSNSNPSISRGRLQLGHRRVQPDDAHLDPVDVPHDIRLQLGDDSP